MPANPIASRHYHSVLWQETLDTDAPALLAHYASLATVEKILSSKELWLSNPLYMNDMEELRFGMQAGAYAFRQNAALRAACADESTHEFLVSEFDKRFQNYDATHALDIFVLCFSAHDTKNTDGVLSMWRGYGAGGDGAALPIDTRPFTSLSDFPLTFGAVKYLSAEDRLQLLSARLDDLAAAIEANERTKDNLADAVRQFFDRLLIFALFTKHPGFREEQEWRAVYVPERDNTGLTQKYAGYLMTARGVEPKLRLPIAELLKKAGLAKPTDLVPELILGPTLSSVLAQASVRRMVASLKGWEEMRVWASGIPFRSTRSAA